MENELIKKEEEIQELKSKIKALKIKQERMVLDFSFKNKSLQKYNGRFDYDKPIKSIVDDYFIRFNELQIPYKDREIKSIYFRCIRNSYKIGGKEVEGFQFHKEILEFSTHN